MDHTELHWILLSSLQNKYGGTDCRRQPVCLWYRYRQKASGKRKKENDFNVHEANNSLWDRPPHTLISAVQPFSCST
jgi:hypothetical protein